MLADPRQGARGDEERERVEDHRGRGRQDMDYRSREGEAGDLGEGSGRLELAVRTTSCCRSTGAGRYAW